MAETSIEWTDATWNPTTGCSAVSPGCTNCYAFPMSRRLGGMGQEKYQGITGQKHFNGVLKTHDDELQKPLHWKKPRKIFVNSMSDLFHKNVPPQFIVDVFTTMYEAQWHTFQVLTKRADKMMSLLTNPRFPWSVGVRAWNRLQKNSPEKADVLTRDEVIADVMQRWPLPNVWLGVSAEDQERWDERVLFLQATPAAVRFISAEPLLGMIQPQIADGLHWIISGGESGLNARPSHPDWHRALRDFCQQHGIAFLFKQWGAWSPGCTYDFYPENKPLHCIKVSGEMSWIAGDVADGAITNYTTNYEESDVAIERHSKKLSGRLLDGREWNEFPKVEAHA